MRCAGTGGGLTGRVVATGAVSGRTWSYLILPTTARPEVPGGSPERPLGTGELGRAVPGVGDCYYRVAIAREHQMPVSGSSVLTWGHRALRSAVETGSRLWARAAAISGGDRRPVERRSTELAAPAGSSPAPPQPPSPPPPTGAGRPGSATTAKAQPRHPVPARVATASVTPAMVRRWAHEQGIQVADRGRIPRSLMERYLAQVARPAAGGRQPSRAPSKSARRSSGRSRSPAA